MNIFVLSKDTVAAAQMHVDKHVVKMVLETAQILSTAVRLAPYVKDPSMSKEACSVIHDAFIKENMSFIYKPSHQKHPCVIWASTNLTRFSWLKKLGIALSEEYTYRYGKIHKSDRIIRDVFYPSTGTYFVEQPLEPFALAMPDIYKTDNVVESYRRYYLGAKQRMLVYTKRAPPSWIPEGVARWKEKNETR